MAEIPDCNSIMYLVKNSSYHHLLTKLKQGSYTQFELDTALGVASAHGDIQSTKVLLSYGADIKHLNENGLPLLHGIVIGNRRDILECLLEYGYDVNYGMDNIIENNYDIPLHTLIWKNEIVMAKLLIGAKFNLDYRDHEWNTAAHVSCICGSLEILNVLIKSGSNIMLQNHKGENCLHLAVKHNHENIIPTLLAHCADINCIDENGDPAILIAAKIRSLSIMKMLYSFPNINFAHKNNDGSTLLHILASYAEPDIVDECLCKSDILVVDSYNNNILNIAACFHNEVLLLHLLQKFKDGIVNNTGFEGKTILHWSILDNMESTFRFLLDMSNINIEIKDNEGTTPLILAVKTNNSHFVQLLLKCGGDPNASDINGWNSLHWTCHKGYMDILNKLLEYQCDLRLVTNNLETFLMLAVKASKLRLLHILNPCTMFEEVSEIVDINDQTILHHAVNNADVEILQFLLENGSLKLLNHKDSENNTAISLAASKGHLEVVHLLLKYNPMVNILGSGLKTPLFCIISTGNFDIVKMLIDYGADPNIDVLTSCLIQASKLGFKDIANLLLSNGAKVDITDHYGRTAFIWACQKCHLDIVKQLLANGADPKIIDKSGDTALTVAAFGGHEDIVSYLLPLSNIDHKETEEGMTALLLALSNGHTKCAKYLIESGANINVKAQNGNTPLIIAIAMDLGIDIIQQILSCYQVIDVNTIGDQSRNAIHWAVSNTEVLKLLLNSNYYLKLNESDENGATPLLLAIAHSLPESAILLLNANCRYDIIHVDGRQPVHHASIYGENQVLQCLIAKGASPFSLTSDSRTPLLLASIEGHAPCVEILLNAGANEMVNDVHFDAVTALSVAVNGSHYKTMDLLLQAGAHPDLIGSKKSRPLIISILRDDCKSVKMLLQYGADIEEYSDLNNHPITVAALKHRWDILALLLSTLTNVNIVRRILKAGAIYYFVLDEPVRDYLVRYIQTPSNLKKLCRTKIRRNIGIPKKGNIHRLPVGKVIREYLLFEKFD